MSRLRRKLLRDSLHLASQLAAIALIVASAVATWITMRGSYEGLLVARDRYYAESRFPDVFAQVRRAPNALLRRISELPGVAAAEGRIVAEVLLDVPGLDEPATGRVISVRTRRPDEALSLVHLREGRMVEPDAVGEVVASVQFAAANSLRTGDRLRAVIQGRWQELRITGIGFSPEFINEISTAESFPDHRRFAVLWMDHDVLATAWGMEGAFNDLAVRMAPGTDARELIATIDPLLAPWGSIGAWDRSEQVSHSFLEDELAQDRISAQVIPAIFLVVAAFLIHMVLTRLVSSQREQIAVLKAFGFEDASVRRHYLGFALIIVAAGTAVGIPLGWFLGTGLTSLYQKYFSFPALTFSPSLGTILLGPLIAAAVASLAAMSAAQRAAAVAPAEGMRGEIPAAFHATMLDRFHRRVAPSMRMILRSLERRPMRALLSITGIAMATAILVMGRYTFDALDILIELQFRTAQREDVTVVFGEPQHESIRHELGRLAGVRRVEPFRMTAARVEHGSVSRRIAVTALDPETELRQLVDRDRRRLTVGPGDVVLSAKLARVLGVEPGGTVRLTTLDGRRRDIELTVTRTFEEMIGLGMYVERERFGRLLQQPGVVSGAWLSVDPGSAAALNRQLKELPGIRGSSFRESMLASFQEMITESLTASMTAIVFFACLIAFGVVYNNARIALSERGRDLASLRVLGFTTREVGVLLLGEQAILVMLALPVGYLLGGGVSLWLARLFDTESYRMPQVVTMEAFAFATVVMLFASALSALVVWRRIRRLDLIEVLKTRE